MPELAFDSGGRCCHNPFNVHGCRPVTSSRLTERLATGRRRPEAGPRWVRIVMAVLATIGLIDTGSIVLKHWGLLKVLSCSSTGLFGCNGCDRVLSSAWGQLFGQPLALYGFLAYGTVLVLALGPLVLRGESRLRLARISGWGLFLTSTAMAVFSAVLLGVMAVALKACCPFCILSAVLSLSLFVLSLLGGELEDPSQTIFLGVITAMVVAVVGLGWAASTGQAPATQSTGKSAPLVLSESSPAKEALAEYLTKQGAVIYTAWWCPHCHEQQELFGRQAAAKLKVIECATDGRNSQTALCEQKKIQGFPTWEIKGKLDSGVKPLKELADLSGYTGPRLF